MADQSITCSVVIAWPGRSVVPQRKPGEKAIGASFTAISASRISWSTVPLKLPRRYSSPSVVASFSASFASNGERAFATCAAISRSAGSRFENTGSKRYCQARRRPSATSRSRSARNLPLLPALVTSVVPPAFFTASGCGTASCVWPPRIASIPVTRPASFRSTSMPLCESRITTLAPLARTSSTCFCRSVSLIPKVHSETK